MLLIVVNLQKGNPLEAVDAILLWQSVDKAVDWKRRHHLVLTAANESGEEVPVHGERLEQTALQSPFEALWPIRLVELVRVENTEILKGFAGVNLHGIS